MCENIYRIFFRTTCAQMLEFWNVALPGGPVSWMFKRRSQVPRVQDGSGPGMLGSSYRNA